MPPFLALESPELPSMPWLVDLMAFLGCVYFAKSLYDKFKSPERQPSMDVDLISLARRVEALEADMKTIDRKLDEGAKLHMELKSGQATNTANIEDIKTNCHDTNGNVRSLQKAIMEWMTSHQAQRAK